MVGVQKLLATFFSFKMPLKQQKLAKYKNEGVIESGSACVWVGGVVAPWQEVGGERKMKSCNFFCVYLLKVTAVVKTEIIPD